MHTLVGLLPLVTVGLIVVLVLVRRFSAARLPTFAQLAARVRPPKKKRGTLLRFERTDMDEQLKALLKNRR